MSPRFVGFETHDVRFPTSRQSDGSDAMNPNPDYSAAYVTLRTDEPGGPAGHGFAFTIGRGNEVEIAAIRALERFVAGRRVDDVCGRMGDFVREMTHDSHLRWLGPEKGVMQMAIAAVGNAAWDLAAKRRGVPVWKLLADLTPEEVVELVDFRYIGDVLRPGEALDLLRARAAGKADRERTIRASGFPAYTTSAGWMGYDDARVGSLIEAAVADGFDHVKLKVGGDPHEDLRRCRLARDILGPQRKLMIDANARWGRQEAIDAVRALAACDLYWVEEPTSCDDILGHAAIARACSPIAVATGEHAANRIVFSQFFEARAIGVCQIDAIRAGGVNEAVAILLLAAKFGVPVCPHAGGVGLCELVQHLAIFDYIAVGASLEGRLIEYVDHLHEHFVDPVRIRSARYTVPSQPGFSSQIAPASLAHFAFPNGGAWQTSAVAPVMSVADVPAGLAVER